jgi:hypothetical protein
MCKILFFCLLVDIVTDCTGNYYLLTGSPTHENSSMFDGPSPGSPPSPLWLPHLPIVSLSIPAVNNVSGFTNGSCSEPLDAHQRRHVANEGLVVGEVGVS